MAFGLLTSAVAGGTLAGMMLAGVRKQRHRGRLLLVVSAAVGSSVAVVGIVHRLWLMAALLFVMAGTAGFLNIQLVSWIQQRVDRAVLGRVMSVLMFAAVGLMPVSLAIAGAAIKWSLAGMFALSGALVLVVTTAAGFHRPVREID